MRASRLHAAKVSAMTDGETEREKAIRLAQIEQRIDKIMLDVTRHWDALRREYDQRRKQRTRKPGVVIPIRGGKGKP